MDLNEIYTESENTEEVAEPQTEELAEETSMEPAEEAETSEDAEGEKVEETAEPQRQSDEQNRIFASMRRKAEEDARRHYEAKESEIYRNLGLVNQATGKLVQTEADYREYLKAANAEKERSLKQELGLSDEEYEDFVNQIPQVREARELKARLEAEERGKKEAEAKAEIDRQLANISALDENIKGLEDLASMENYEGFYALVQKGYALDDAYKLTHFENLSRKKASAETQKAMNMQASKGHLAQTVAQGQGAVQVPDSVIRDYKKFNPNMTDEQIRKHYAKYLKDTERG